MAWFLWSMESALASDLSCGTGVLGVEFPGVSRWKNWDDRVDKTLVNAPRVCVCVVLYELVHGNVECRAKRRRNDNGKKVSFIS